MLYTVLYYMAAKNTYKSVLFEGPHNRGDAISAALKKLPFLASSDIEVVALVPGVQELITSAGTIIPASYF